MVSLSVIPGNLNNCVCSLYTFQIHIYPPIVILNWSQYIHIYELYKKYILIHKKHESIV